jgi:hypothetical protein
MPRYVILEHDSPRGRHWDLLLESGNVLKAWALSKAPAAGETIACEILPDHRLLYLNYEGPISGDRGSVTRWDAGDYEVLQQNDTQLVVQLAGVRRTGKASLTRLSPADNRWEFCLE